MNRVKLLTCLLIASCIIACTPQTPPTPPSNTSIAATVAELYRLTGIVTPIVSQRVLGKHYSPHHDHWTVIACVELDIGGNQSSDCNDSFTLIKLDSGMWIIRGTVNAQYRWMAVSK